MAQMLSRPLGEIPTDYSLIDDAAISNEWRQKRIIHDFIKDHWQPFVVVKASDFIFYKLLCLDFDEFVALIYELRAGESSHKIDFGDKGVPDDFKRYFDPIKDIYEPLHHKVVEAEKYIETEGVEGEMNESWRNLDFQDLQNFRSTLKDRLRNEVNTIIESKLQLLGNRIRRYGSVKEDKEARLHRFSGLSEIIDLYIEVYKDNHRRSQHRIVIDALRSPADILYFRERYAYFYLMSVSADESVRNSNLFKANITLEQKKEIDQGEDKPKGGVYNEFANVHISRCLEMADIHLVNYGDKPEQQEKIGSQILRYITLILHPGLVQPTPYERVMQVALSARASSGCLSRQVGAAVTNAHFSVMSIGWNEVPKGQIPCSLRYMADLMSHRDRRAFSAFEHTEDFLKLARPVLEKFIETEPIAPGVHHMYCFKDIYTTGTRKQTHNQVHTRAMHAEENAFMQLAKYGTGQSVVGGKLFTTASCCVLCAKKAYQLGIKEILYIDAYPDISQSHILESGYGDIEMRLFEGVTGRAYFKLYDQFIALKDELELDYGFNVKSEVKQLVKPETDDNKLSEKEV